MGVGKTCGEEGRNGEKHVEKRVGKKKKNMFRSEKKTREKTRERNARDKRKLKDNATKTRNERLSA